MIKLLDRVQFISYLLKKQTHKLHFVYEFVFPFSYYIDFVSFSDCSDTE